MQIMGISIFDKTPIREFLSEFQEGTFTLFLLVPTKTWTVSPRQQRGTVNIFFIKQ
jgi:hypothetical protein